MSFCGHAILGVDLLLVPDASKDSRFADNPLVTGEPFVRFYAGYPLEADDGSKVGTLCVIDREPRDLSAEQIETIRDLARCASSELRLAALSAEQQELIGERDELRRRAMLDSLARTWNRSAIDDLLVQELARSERDGSPLGVIMADLDHFKRINDTHGHLAGDAVLAAASGRLRSALRPYDAIGRYGGEEFLIVLPRCDEATARRIAERIRTEVSQRPCSTMEATVQATVSLGFAVLRGAAVPAYPKALVRAADKALYRAKRTGRNRVEG